MFVFFLCSFCLIEPHFFITNLLKYTIKVYPFKAYTSLAFSVFIELCNCQKEASVH